jgi:hypothetical protein
VSCNLERRGVRKRLRHAAIYGAALILTVVALLTFDAPRAWRWVVWAPAFLTAIGFLQAATKTCVLFGAWGVREAPTNIVRIENDRERRALLVRSIVITSAAAVLGAAFAAIVVHV